MFTPNFSQWLQLIKNFPSFHIIVLMKTETGRRSTFTNFSLFHKIPLTEYWEISPLSLLMKIFFCVVSTFFSWFNFELKSGKTEEFTSKSHTGCCIVCTKYLVCLNYWNQSWKNFYFIPAPSPFSPLYHFESSYR